MIPERANFVNAAIGLCIITVGIVMLLHSLGVVDAFVWLRYWPLALVLIGAAVTVQAIRGGAGASQAPIGAVLMVILLGLLASRVAARRPSGPGVSDGRVQVFAVMTGNRASGVAGPFHGGDVTAVMGGAELDLRQATIEPGQEAVLDLFTVMGGTGLRIPDDWIVDSRALTIAGGVSDKRHHDEALPSSPDVAPPRLVLRGTVLMGGVNIRP
jgi:hypothetical protein